MPKHIKVSWKGPSISREIRKSLADGIRAFAHDLKAEVDDECPVDTGLLRSNNAVKSDARSLTYTVINDTDYSGYVHGGTSRQNANPWMRRAVDRMIARANRYFGRGR